MAYRNDDYRRDFPDRDDVRGWRDRGHDRDYGYDRDHDHPLRRSRSYGGWDPGQYGYGERDRDRDPSRPDWRTDWRDDDRRPSDVAPDWRADRYGDARGGRYDRPDEGSSHARWGSAGPFGTGTDPRGLGPSGVGTGGFRSGIPSDEFRGRDRIAYDADHDRSHGRGLWQRTRDEFASWFGDDDAQRRRSHDDHRGRGPRGYVRSDERIREDVCDRLTDDPFVDASDVEIGVVNGEVTLSGTVTSREARRRAEDTVERVLGVQHVQNNLRVQRPGMGGMMDATGGMTAGTVPTAGVPDSGFTGSERGRH